jgi:hypothetical protein
MDWKSATFLVMTLVPILLLRNSKFSRTTRFSYFCSRMRLTADVRTIGGGRPVLAGAVASRGEDSVLAESVSTSHARSGAKKFRVATSLGGVSTAADTAVSTAFIDVEAVSFVLCRMRLRASLKHPPGWQQTLVS